MNYQRLLLAITIGFLCWADLSAARTAISLTEYRQQLQDISDKVASLGDHPDQAGTVIAAIPDKVMVRILSGEITANYHVLKNELTLFSKADPKVKSRNLETIQTYLLALQSQAAACELPDHTSSARQKLGEILARREFRNVHGPGLKETLLARLYRWLARLLGHIRLGGSATSSVLQVVVYVLVALALLILVFWTVNRLRRKEEVLPTREIIPFSPSARSWRAWLMDARAEAEKQDWRSAIHLAYWAAISFLESGGAWKPNRARTPREYLCLLTSRSPNYPPLSALTRKFEVVWYGERPAAQQDFQDALGQLEKMGCR
jgi:uncharacterized protein DUF4129